MTERAPLQPVERILNHGSFASTYKFALLRAIGDWLIEHPHGNPGDRRIPLAWVAVKFLDYYWPLTVPEPVGQAAKGQRRTRIQALIADHVQRTNKRGHGHPGLDRLTNEPVYWPALKERLMSPDHDVPAGIDLVRRARKVIIDQPLTYIQNIQGEPLDFFEVEGVARAATHGRYRADPASDEALAEARTITDLELLDRAAIVLPAPMYDRLAPLRFCIREATIGKWAATTPVFDTGTRGLDALALLQDHEPERDSLLATRYREVYHSNGLAERCVLTGAALDRAWQLDHLAPWSRFPVNRFWNLMPLTRKVNNLKRDRLVQLAPEQRRRVENHVAGCIDAREPLIEADIAATVGTSVRTPEPAWFVDHVTGLLDNLAELTGLPRWQVPVEGV